MNRFWLGQGEVGVKWQIVKPNTAFPCQDRSQIVPTLLTPIPAVGTRASGLNRIASSDSSRLSVEPAFYELRAISPVCPGHQPGRTGAADTLIRAPQFQ
jgi:hypothetical protein